MYPLSQLIVTVGSQTIYWSSFGANNPGIWRNQKEEGNYGLNCWYFWRKNSSCHDNENVKYSKRSKLKYMIYSSQRKCYTYTWLVDFSFSDSIFNFFSFTFRRPSLRVSLTVNTSSNWPVLWRPFLKQDPCASNFWKTRKMCQTSLVHLYIWLSGSEQAWRDGESPAGKRWEHLLLEY